MGIRISSQIICRQSAMYGASSTVTIGPRVRCETEHKMHESLSTEPSRDATTDVHITDLKKCSAIMHELTIRGTGVGILDFN
eukprot:scaffold576772_cov43-Prasinocladus_malaysianus.AAC.1